MPIRKTSRVSLKTLHEKWLSTLMQLLPDRRIHEKVMNAGRQAGCRAREAGNWVLEVSKDKFTNIKTVAGPHLSRFHQDVTDASQQYVNDVVNRMGPVNDKLENIRDSIGPSGRYIKRAALAIGIVTAAAYDKILAASPSFGELSPKLRLQMIYAGLGEERGWRSVTAAESFYESSVSEGIRNLGESAVVEFLDGKHASHIKSVHQAPSLTIEDSNLVWEAAKDNLARGSANMTGVELAGANISNLIDAAGVVAGQTLEIAATAGCVGMALEGVVSFGENLIYVYRGERTAKEAAIDVAKSMAEKGMIAAASGAVISVAIAFGAGPVLSGMAPVMVTIGGTVYLIGAVSRITTAYQETQKDKALDLLVGSE